MKLKFLGDDTGSSSNPFKRLAAKNADSTWVKTETEVKSEKSEEKNVAPDATSEDDQKEILTGEEEEKNGGYIACFRQTNFIVLVGVICDGSV